MIETFLLLALSLAILAFSSELTISNSLVLARFFHISEFAVGFLLISVATSLPEIMVSFFASSGGEAGLALGNVFGSNIANICLVVGISTLLVGELVVRRKEVRSLAKILSLTSLIPLVLLIAPGFSFYGILLLAVFLIYVYHILREDIGASARKKDAVGRKEGIMGTVLFLASISVVVLSAQYAVGYAITLSDQMGMEKSFIGSTLVAMGTSLPEIVVGVSAVRRKKVSLALGNVMGSSITNLTLVLGTAALFSPVVASIPAFAKLVFFSLLVNILLWDFLGDDMRISKKEAGVLLFVYAAFIVVSAGLEFAP
jgi:cation:H+ antiporter